MLLKHASLMALRMTSSINNEFVPTCINCKHFSPNSHGLKCTKFGNKDLVNGKVTYKNAEDCRNREELCGIDGTYFEHDSKLNIFARKSKRLTADNILIIVPIAYFVILFITVLISVILNEQ